MKIDILVSQIYSVASSYNPLMTNAPIIQKPEQIN